MGSDETDLGYSKEKTVLVIPKSATKNEFILEITSSGAANRPRLSKRSIIGARYKWHDLSNDADLSFLVKEPMFLLR